MAIASRKTKSKTRARDGTNRGRPNRAGRNRPLFSKIDAELVDRLEAASGALGVPKYELVERGLELALAEVADEVRDGLGRAANRLRRVRNSFPGGKRAARRRG